MLYSSIKKLEQKVGLSLKSILLVFSILIVLGIYIANIFFGKNSIYTLIELRDKKHNLLSEIQKLKNENQVFQKSYFELKQLEAKDNIWEIFLKK